MKSQKFVSEPSANLKGYVIARYNEVTEKYEPLSMTLGQQELVEKLAKELSLEYEENFKESNE